MAIDSRNEMVRSAQGVPVKGDPKRSFLSYPINCGRAEVGVVREYNAETGIATVNSIWDTAEPPKDFFVACVFSGKLDEPPPANDEVDAGSFLVYHRVGEFNSRGLNPSGVNPLPELREESADKVSYYSFFEVAGVIDVPVDVFAALDVFATEFPTELVETSREGEEFLDLGMRQLLVFDVVDRDGEPHFVGQLGKRVLFSATDDFVGVTTRGLVLVDPCDGLVVDAAAFSFVVVGGRVKGTGEEVLVFSGSGSSVVFPVFCDTDFVPGRRFTLPPQEVDTRVFFPHVEALTRDVARGILTLEHIEDEGFFLFTEQQFFTGVIFGDLSRDVGDRRNTTVDDFFWEIRVPVTNETLIDFQWRTLTKCVDGEVLAPEVVAAGPVQVENIRFAGKRQQRLFGGRLFREVDAFRFNFVIPGVIDIEVELQLDCT